jgi:N-acetylglucosamine kinase-like BadF-type ATPase
MYFLGVDGGGTKTKVLIINESNKIIFSKTGKASSIDTVDEDTTINNINDVLIQAKVNISNLEFTAVFIGIGGIFLKKDENKVKKMARRLIGVTKNTIIDAKSDAIIALRSSGYKNNIIALIVGTGTVCYGINENDTSYRVSGYGYKEGELGSGFHLGFRALQYLTRFLDKRIEETPFLLAMKENSLIKRKEDIIDAFDKYYNNRTLVASYAKIVVSYALKYDKYALQIIDEATTENLLSIKAVCNELNLTEPRLIIVGSLGKSVAYFEMLMTKISEYNRNIMVVGEKYAPEMAACLLAKELVKS